jgi:hypothetical protein
MNALHPMKNPIVDGEIPVSIWYSKKTHTSNWDNIYWLVVDLYSSEKYDFVSWEDDIPNSRWKKKCSKAPTSFASFFRQDAGELSAAQLVHGISALTIRRQTRVPLILLGSLVRWFCAKRGSTWDPRKTPRPTTGISSAELGDDHIPSGKLT